MGKFLISLIGGGLFLLLQIVIISCDHAQPEVDPDDFNPHSRVTVTLVDHTIHIPRCNFIEGTTEAMKYGAAIGKDYVVCERCFVEDVEVEENIDKAKEKKRKVRSLLSG